MKRFAQVSRLGHQISLEGDRIEGERDPCMGGAGGGDSCTEGSQGRLYGHVQCMIGKI